jgi:hypothetical protein
MENLTHYPVLVFAVAFVSLSLASAAGVWLRRRYPRVSDEQKDDLSVILAASLTLLALIIGFSFSMATNRYDQRKNFEEAEANAIGTELLRADLLPPADAAAVRKLLGDYLDHRIVFYINKDDAQRARIDERTSQLETALWAAVRCRTADACCCTVVCWHERRDQFPRLHAGGVLESDSYRRVVSNGDHCAVLQRSVRLSVAKRRKACPRAAARRLDFLSPDRRYRCSAAWLDLHQSTKSGKFGGVPWTMTVPLIGNPGSVVRWSR